MTSRELVIATLEFRNKEGRVPRALSHLPWAEMHYPSEVARLYNEYPDDMTGPPVILKKPTIEQGDPHEIGIYIDAWGCRFANIQRGVIGEIEEPLVKDDDWEDVDNIHIPVEWLDFDEEQARAYCKATDKFCAIGTPRPFEQLQFIRASENLYMDLVDIPAKMKNFMQKMHTFYCDYLEKWAKTGVDALTFMDDWGSQKSLLISPAMWDEIFRPMYQDYIDIAKRHNLKSMMHSDGYTLDIYPRLIEMGLDAFNSQIFCMGVDELKKYKGKITFWGEIDRQHLLPHGTVQDIENAVKDVYENLWCDGGCVAMCEFGPAAKPENVFAVYETWNRLRP